MDDLIKSIEAFRPFNEQEEKDKYYILQYIQQNEDCADRTNKVAHLTASAWVVNATHDKALMVYHNIYQSWSWLGGHADGNCNLLEVATREVMEESGLKQVRPVSENIFSLEILTVDGHWKKGEYISSHLHLNVTYLLEADEADVLLIKPDENSGVSWFTLDEAIAASTESWFQEHIYKKLNDKLRKIDG